MRKLIFFIILSKLRILCVALTYQQTLIPLQLKKQTQVEQQLLKNPIEEARKIKEKINWKRIFSLATEEKWCIKGEKENWMECETKGLSCAFLQFLIDLHVITNIKKIIHCNHVFVFGYMMKI